MAGIVPETQHKLAGPKEPIEQSACNQALLRLSGTEQSINQGID